MGNMDQSKDPQIQPIGGKMSTESLPAKEPADLAEELERLLDSMTDETYDASAIDAYLAALEEKAPAPQMKDPKVAYEDLQRRIRKLSASENSGSKPQAHVCRHLGYAGWKRYAAVVAATVCLTFALMIGAQATGVDVFGNLAKWTSETFSFVFLSKKAAEQEYLAEFRSALEQHEIPIELVPTWVPKGFITNGPQIDEENPFCDLIYMDFVHEDGRGFSINIEHHFSSEILSAAIYEKDSSNVELYTSNGRTFYIMSNINTITATWADGIFMESITGFLSADEVKQMIDSIGR